MTAATVSKGAVSSQKKASKAAPKLGDILAKEAEQDKGAVSFISRKGADSAWVFPPGPRHNAAGVHIGMDEGVRLDFQGVGVTKPYFPGTNKVHRELVNRVKQGMEDGIPIFEELGIEVLAPEAPRPPFAKWDTTSAAALKVAFSVLLGDDHDGNVELVKAAARYEKANLDRDDVMQMLDGLLATEAAQSDAFDVQVTVA